MNENKNEKKIPNFFFRKKTYTPSIPYTKFLLTLIYKTIAQIIHTHIHTQTERERERENDDFFFT